MALYAIVQEKFEPIAFDHLRQVLIDHGGLVRADASRAARKVRGILTERLSINQAAEVCNALKKLNYSVRVVPADKLPSLKKARVTRWLEMHDDHLALPRGTTNVVEKVLWPNVFVIHAGRIAETKERDVVDFNSDSDSPFTVETETQKYSEFVHVTELIALSSNGGLLHVRLPAHGMNYARVLGPDLIHQGFFGKYLSMLDVLVERSRAALVSPETSELLQERKQHFESRDGDFYELSEQRKFLQYVRWLLQLVLFRESEPSE